MIIIWAVFVLLGVSFLLIVFRGAPFVPTHHAAIQTLFRLHHFRKDDVLVDLGSGDGRVLVAAAQKGIRAVGYELNPFLVWYSRLKLRRFTPAPEVRLADFWLSPLPKGTAVVFVFLAKPFMAKLDSKLEREALRLGHDILLVSYGMKISSKTPESVDGGMVVYRYSA